MGKHPIYPAYKASGIEWLGEIPSHWEISKIRHVITHNTGGAWGSDFDDDLGTIVLRSTEQTVDGKWYIEDPARRLLTATERRQTRLRAGDLLITKSSGSRLHIGKTTIVDENIEQFACGYSNFMQRIRIGGNHCPMFFYFLLNSEAGREQFHFNSNTTTGLANLNSTVIANTWFALPPLPEQEAIARFLDHKTAQIDALIAKKETLLARLADKRTALISRAVTKGLDPSAPMRDSGIEWLGEIPAHWKATKVKYLVEGIIDTEHKTAPFYPDGEYLVVRTSNVRNGNLIFDDAKYTDYEGFQKWTKRAVPEPGDVIFTREAPAGEACVVPDGLPLCLGQRTVLFRIKKDHANSEFVVYSIYAGLADEFVKSLSQGSTVSHFNMSDIGNIPLFDIPLDEETRIVSEIRRGTNQIA